MTIKLIELYEDYPCLYRITSKDYHNKNIREVALQEIAEKLNKSLLSSLSAVVIKKQIHGIRTQFLHEVAKIKKSKVTGSSKDDVYIPKLWCFELLSFLSDSAVPVTPGESNLELDETENEEFSQTQFEDGAEVLFRGTTDELIDFNLESSDISARSIKRKLIATAETPQTSKSARKTKINRVNVETLMEETTRSLDSMISTPEHVNEFTLFGQMMAAELQKINNEEILDELKGEILLAVFRSKKKCRD